MRRIATSSSSTAVGSPERDRLEQRVLRHPRLRLQAGPGRARAAGADQPGGTDEQGQRLLGGGEARSQQVQIDVEEGHGGGAADAMQHRLGADEDRASAGTGDSRPPARGPATSPTSAPSSAASSSRRRLTPARNVFIRSRPQAAHTTGRVSSQRGQRSTSSPRGCATAAPQRAQQASSPQWRQASRRAPPVRL